MGNCYCINYSCMANENNLPSDVLSCPLLTYKGTVLIIATCCSSVMYLYVRVHAIMFIELSVMDGWFVYEKYHVVMMCV